MGWVTDREKCSAKAQFDKLKGTVKEAVEERNGCSPIPNFKYLESPTVVAVRTLDGASTIRFSLDGNEITIESTGYAKPYRVLSCLDFEGNCFISIDPDPFPEYLRPERITIEHIAQCVLTGFLFGD